MAPRQVTYCRLVPSLSPPLPSHSPPPPRRFKFRLIDTRRKHNVCIILSRKLSRLYLSIHIWTQVRKTIISLLLSVDLSFMRLDETAVKSVRKIAKGHQAMWHFALRKLRERERENFERLKFHALPFVALRPFYLFSKRSLALTSVTMRSTHDKRVDCTIPSPQPVVDTIFPIGGDAYDTEPEQPIWL